jgi:hypothetical protein
VPDICLFSTAPLNVPGRSSRRCLFLLFEVTKNWARADAETRAVEELSPSRCRDARAVEELSPSRCRDARAVEELSPSRCRDARSGSWALEFRLSSLPFPHLSPHDKRETSELRKLELRSGRQSLISFPAGPPLCPDRLWDPLGTGCAFPREQSGRSVKLYLLKIADAAFIECETGQVPCVGTLFNKSDSNFLTSDRP